MPWLAAAALLCAAVYAPVLHAGFISGDDYGYVLHNPLIRSLSPANIRQMFSSLHLNLYSPLTTLSFALDYRFWQLNPAGYHLENMLLHFLNCAFAMLLAFFLYRRRGEETAGGGAVFTAGLAGLLFAAHPMHVESVAWITERKDMLSSFFLLGCCLCWMRWIRNGSRKAWTGSAVLFLLSLLVKPAAIYLPGLLFLFDWYVRREFRIADKIPHMLLALGFLGLMTARLFTPAPDIHGAPLALGLADRMAMGAYGLWFYLWKIIWPVNLCAVYPYPMRPSGGIERMYYPAIPAALAVCCAGAWFAKRSREAAFGLIFFLLGTLPFLQFVQTGQGIVSERYSYIPYLGIFFMTAHFAARALLCENRKLRIAVAVAATAVIFLLAGISHSRALVWRDSETLWHDVMRKQPGAQTAPFNLGAYYIETGRCTQAVALYTSGIKAGTRGADIYSNRAAAYVCSRDFVNAQEDYLAALKYLPDDAGILYGLGLTLAMQGRVAQAKQIFMRAIDADPDFAPALCAYGNALRLERDFKNARIYFERAIKASPGYALSYADLGMVELAEGNKNGALALAVKALYIEPGNPDAAGLKAAIIQTYR